MKTITGLFAILLGALGALVTLAIIVVVWLAAFKLMPQVEKVTTYAGEGLVEVEKAFSGLRQQLTSTRDSVEAVRASAVNASREGSNTPATKAEAERLKNDLLPLIDRSDVISEVLPQTAQTIDDAANVAQQSGDKSRADRLRSIASSVREAAKELEAVRNQAAEIRRSESSPTAKELADLAQRTEQPLDRLTKALADVKQESETLRGDLPAIRRTLDGWIIIGAAIITAILAWIGLGQLAIVAWGRRRLAARNVPPPVASTPGAPPSINPK